MEKVLKRLHLFGTWRRLCVFLVNHIFVGTRFFGVKRALLGGAGFDIGEGTRVVGPLHVTTELSVGRDCWVGRDFAANGNGRVRIGDRCDIAPQVSLNTGGHEIGGPERRAGKGCVYDITVGSGTWLCAGSTVLGGVSVGESCVVAACACVVSDVPDDSLVGGVPARLIRRLGGC